MANDVQKLVDQLIAGSVFGLVLTVWVVGVWVWFLRRSSGTQRIGQRLGLAGPRGGPTRVLRLWHEEGEATTVVHGATKQPSLAARLNQLLRTAGWEVPLRTMVLALVGVVALSVAVTVSAAGSVVVGLGVAAVALILFWIYLKRRVAGRAALFDQQLIDALDLAARSLRAGHPLGGAFRMISEELPAPVGPVFAEICQQQAMGSSMEDALRKAAAACTSAEMKLLATSVIIQMRTGGNLADLMGRVAFVIRDRLRLSRRVRVLTAQAQFSKRVLLALPLVMFVVLNFLNPNYMENLYTTSTGLFVLAAAGASVVLGAWTMNRLVVLHY